MGTGRILIIEDENKIADIVRDYLNREGYEVSVAPDGETALRLIKKSYDLIILDLMLPDIDGEIICQSIREFSEVPIIMLTAKSSEDDRVVGLGLGADDYVLKPFSPRELVARVKALLRRAVRKHSLLLSFNNGELIIDLQAQNVLIHGSPIQLTSTQFKILLHFAENPKIVLSRLQIVNVVQGYDFEGFDRVIDAHIKNIRHKIERDPQNPVFIKTIYGSGYKFIGIPDHKEATS